MRSGRLDKYISIEALDGAVDDDGAPTAVWVTVYANVPANIVPNRGTEYFAAAATKASVATTIRFRYLSGVLPLQRITWNTKIFEIISVVDLFKSGRWLELQCNELVNI